MTESRKGTKQVFADWRSVWWLRWVEVRLCFVCYDLSCGLYFRRPTMGLGADVCMLVNEWQMGWAACTVGWWGWEWERRMGWRFELVMGRVKQVGINRVRVGEVEV
ncbi:MAG: hypothetical protein N3G20_11945 [Verrucomicrobiae bacterium]|nr:hypothetical protein [Verrucomicrobiae bacterium]